MQAVLDVHLTHPVAQFEQVVAVFAGVVNVLILQSKHWLVLK